MFLRQSWRCFISVRSASFTTVQAFVGSFYYLISVTGSLFERHLSNFKYERRASI